MEAGRGWKLESMPKYLYLRMPKDRLDSNIFIFIFIFTFVFTFIFKILKILDDVPYGVLSFPVAAGWQYGSGSDVEVPWLRNSNQVRMACLLPASMKQSILVVGQEPVSFSVQVLSPPWAWPFNRPEPQIVTQG